MNCTKCHDPELDFTGQVGSKTTRCTVCGHVAPHGISFAQITHLDGKARQRASGEGVKLALLALSFLLLTAPVVASTVVLSESGNGEQTTQKFKVHDDWDLKWSYDCSDFGMKGMFAAEISGSPNDPEVGPTSQGLNGSGTTHLHGGAGKRYLEIISNCSWKIQAISL